MSNGQGSIELDNLGGFYLDGSANGYTGQPFTLFVTFTAPGPASALYTAALLGQVNSNQGGVFIDFDNTPQSFAYNNGTFSLAVNDVSIIAPPSGQIRGISLSGNVAVTASSSVPEPASMALLGTGLVGLLVMRRRRPSA